MLPVVTNNGSISNFFVFQHKIIDLYESPYPAYRYFRKTRLLIIEIKGCRKLCFRHYTRIMCEFVIDSFHVFNFLAKSPYPTLYL